MGYKVQVYSTTNLDDAQSNRTKIQSLIDSLAIEIVFNAPYYKLRTGNFIDRQQADSLKDFLQSRGIPTAWVVRDQIVRTVRESSIQDSGKKKATPDGR